MKILKWIIYLTISIMSLSLFAGNLTSNFLYQRENDWNAFSNKKFLLCRIDSHRTHRESETSLKIEFDENSTEVSEDDKLKINHFVRGFSQFTGNFKMTAHADQCGHEDDNLILSEKRAQSVLDEILSIKNIRVGTKINISAKGESESDRHHRHDRYVELSAIHSPGLQQEFEDIVLIDGSGSLQSGVTYSGYRFNSLKKMQFRPKTLVYVVREKKYGCKGTNLKNYYPEGQTFISAAQAVLAQSISGFSRVHVYSDGDPQNDEGLSVLQKRQLNQARSTAQEDHGVIWYYR